MIRVVPHETKFFEMFSEMAGNLNQAADLLGRILRNLEREEPETQVQRLKQIEQAGDEITHALLTKLNQTFITPFDREDIHRLASSLDDVLDFIYAAGERLVMYDVRQCSASAVELAGIILRQCGQISSALSTLDRHDQVLKHCVEISRLEKEADRIARGLIAALFKQERDPINLIKLKELYEVLETATDKADDVANVLESIVVKSA